MDNPEKLATLGKQHKDKKKAKKQYVLNTTITVVKYLRRGYVVCAVTTYARHFAENTA